MSMLRRLPPYREPGWQDGLMDADRCTPPRITVAIPLGGRMVVAGDLFLQAPATPASLAAAAELSSAIKEMRHRGVLVIAGNLFDLSDRPAEDLPAALRAHPRLRDALTEWLGDDRHRVILLPGTRDRAICYDTTTMAQAGIAGFEVALSVDAEIETRAGIKRVRVEPGWRYDPLNAYGDPTDPRDTPIGHHALSDVFPMLKSARTGWLSGLDRLADPAGLPRFVTSRLMYRRLGRYVWWLLVPIAVAALAHLPEVALFGGRLHDIARPLAEVAISLALELLAIAVLLGIVNHRVWAGPGSALLGPPSERANDAARDAARDLVASGYSGLVTGHSLRAELVSLGDGFFANTGACAELVEERRALSGCRLSLCATSRSPSSRSRPTVTQTAAARATVTRATAASGRAFASRASSYRRAACWSASPSGGPDLLSASKWWRRFRSVRAGPRSTTRLVTAR